MAPAQLSDRSRSSPCSSTASGSSSLAAPAAGAAPVAGPFLGRSRPCDRASRSGQGDQNQPGQRTREQPAHDLRSSRSGAPRHGFSSPSMLESDRRTESAGTVPRSDQVGGNSAFVVNTEDLASCCDHRFLTHRSVVAVRWSNSLPKRARQFTAPIHAKSRPLSPVRNMESCCPSPCSKRIIPYRKRYAGATMVADFLTRPF